MAFYRGPFEQGASYSIGDEVNYEHLKYECSNAIANAVLTPNNDETHWTLIARTFTQIATGLNALTGTDRIAISAVRGGDTDSIIMGIETQTGDERLSYTALKDTPSLDLPIVSRNLDGETAVAPAYTDIDYDDSWFNNFNRLEQRQRTWGPRYLLDLTEDRTVVGETTRKFGLPGQIIQFYNTIPYPILVRYYKDGNFSGGSRVVEEYINAGEIYTFKRDNTVTVKVSESDPDTLADIEPFSFTTSDDNIPLEKMQHTLTNVIKAGASTRNIERLVRRHNHSRNPTWSLNVEDFLLPIVGLQVPETDTNDIKVYYRPGSSNTLIGSTTWTAIRALTVIDPNDDDNPDDSMAPANTRIELTSGTITVWIARFLAANGSSYVAASVEDTSDATNADEVVNFQISSSLQLKNILEFPVLTGATNQQSKVWGTSDDGMTWELRDQATGGGSTFSGNYNDLSGIPTSFPTTWGEVSGKPTFFSGSWNDLTDKPTIPTIPSTWAWADITGKPNANSYIPSGGTDNQILRKTGDGDYEVQWEDMPIIPTINPMVFDFVNTRTTYELGKSGIPAVNISSTNITGSASLPNREIGRFSSFIGPEINLNPSNIADFELPAGTMITVQWTIVENVGFGLVLNTTATSTFSAVDFYNDGIHSSATFNTIRHDNTNVSEPPEGEGSPRYVLFNRTGEHTFRCSVSRFNNRVLNVAPDVYTLANASYRVSTTGSSRAINKYNDIDYTISSTGNAKLEINIEPKGNALNQEIIIYESELRSLTAIDPATHSGTLYTGLRYETDDTNDNTKIWISRNASNKMLVAIEDWDTSNTYWSNSRADITINKVTGTNGIHVGDSVAIANQSITEIKLSPLITRQFVPSGGTTNQALLKNSNTDYDFKWADAGISIGNRTITAAEIVDADQLIVLDNSVTDDLQKPKGLSIPEFKKLVSSDTITIDADERMLSYEFFNQMGMLTESAVFSTSSSSISNSPTNRITDRLILIKLSEIENTGFTLNSDSYTYHPPPGSGSDSSSATFVDITITSQQIRQMIDNSTRYGFDNFGNQLNPPNQNSLRNRSAGMFFQYDSSFDFGDGNEPAILIRTSYRVASSDFRYIRRVFTPPTYTYTATTNIDFSTLRDIGYNTESMADGLYFWRIRRNGITIWNEPITRSELRALTAQTEGTAVAGLTANTHTIQVDTGRQIGATVNENFIGHITISSDNSVLCGIEGWTNDLWPRPEFDLLLVNATLS